MKFKNKEKAYEICSEIERIKEGLKMIKMAKGRKWKLTFAISTSDARGFILESAYLFNDNHLIGSVIESAKMELQALEQQLKSL